MSDNEDFVRASLNGDAVTAGAAFDDLMRAKLNDRIDALRQNTAANLVATPGAEEDGEENSSES